jgi:hypothetical protein
MKVLKDISIYPLPAGLALGGRQFDQVLLAA